MPQRKTLLEMLTPQQRTLLGLTALEVGSMLQRAFSHTTEQVADSADVVSGEPDLPDYEATSTSAAPMIRPQRLKPDTQAVLNAMPPAIAHDRLRHVLEIVGGLCNHVASTDERSHRALVEQARARIRHVVHAPWGEGLNTAAESSTAGDATN